MRKQRESSRSSARKKRERPDSISSVGRRERRHGSVIKNTSDADQVGSSGVFMKDTTKNQYVLNSFPRSGNTFLRYLLEWFGHDVELKKKHDNPIEFENVKIIKSHTYQPKIQNIIFILRHPDDSIHSNVSRAGGFGSNAGANLHEKQVKDCIELFEGILNSKKNVYTILYDDLVNDTEKILLGVFDHIGVKPVVEITAAEIEKVREKSQRFYTTKFAGKKGSQKEEFLKHLRSNEKYPYLMKLYEQCLKLHKSKE